jgi:myo-inositol catabolism protein IolS
MEKRALGLSGLQASVLGLGCWPLGGGPGWGDQDERLSIATIHAALDHGINLLDTAEAYNDGHSEELVGKALLGRRDRALVATKIAPQNAAPATLRAHCEASLRRLQTDYIDLYQVHWPISEPLVEDGFATLRTLQSEGKVRAIGISNHGVQQVRQVLATDTPIACNQLCYNLLCRAIEIEIAPLCAEHKIAILAYMPLMQGLLTGKYPTADDVPTFRARSRHFSSARPEARHGEPGAETETFAALAGVARIAEDLHLSAGDMALAWVIAHQGVASVLVGCRTPDQVAANVAAAAISLSPEAIAHLDAATDALRLKLGPNADYWQSNANRRTY